MQRTVKIVFFFTLLYVTVYLLVLVGLKKEPAYFLTEVPLNEGIIPSFVTPGDSVEIVLMAIKSTIQNYRIDSLDVIFHPVKKADGSEFRWRPQKIITPGGSFNPSKPRSQTNKRILWDVRASIKFVLPNEEEFYSSILAIDLKGRIIYPTMISDDGKEVILEKPVKLVKTIMIGSHDEKAQFSLLKRVLKNILYACLVMLLLGLVIFGFFF